MELEPDEAGTDLCGTCTLCLQACPTGAIIEPYVVDAGRCISYLTIELRGAEPPLADELRRGLGNRIFGCDDCLDICPYNLQAEPTSETGFQPTSLTRAPSLLTMAKMTEQTFATTFKHSPVRRAKYSGASTQCVLGTGQRTHVQLIAHPLYLHRKPIRSNLPHCFSPADSDRLRCHVLL